MEFTVPGSGEKYKWVLSFHVSLRFVTFPGILRLLFTKYQQDLDFFSMMYEVCNKSGSHWYVEVLTVDEMQSRGTKNILETLWKKHLVIVDPLFRADNFDADGLSVLGSFHVKITIHGIV